MRWRGCRAIWAFVAGSASAFLRRNAVLTFKGDDRRRFHVDGAAWCRTPEAVFTALAPVPQAVVFLVAVTFAAGYVVGRVVMAHPSQSGPVP
jgi:hypothetical protein